MIKAGNYFVEDKGFSVSTEQIGGVTRQALTLELPGGISGTSIAALCKGPIQVTDENGGTAHTYTGPFRVVSHGLKLVRESSEVDVAALSAHINELEAALAEERSKRESAVSQLATVSGRLEEMKATIAKTAGTIATEEIQVSDAGGNSL